MDWSLYSACPGTQSRFSLDSARGKTFLGQQSPIEVGLHLSQRQVTKPIYVCKKRAQILPHFHLYCHPKLFTLILNCRLSRGERAALSLSPEQPRGAREGEAAGVKRLFIDEEWKQACRRIMSFWAQLWPRGTELSPSPITNETHVISSSALDSV